MVIHSYYGRRVLKSRLVFFLQVNLWYWARRRPLRPRLVVPGYLGKFVTLDVDADRTEHVDGSHSAKHR